MAHVVFCVRNKKEMEGLDVSQHGEEGYIFEA